MGSRTSRAGQVSLFRGLMRRWRVGPLCAFRASACALLLLLLGVFPESSIRAEPRSDGLREFRMHPTLGRIDARARRIQIEPTIRLEEIRADELLPDATQRAISLGSYARGGAVPAGRTMDPGIVRHVPVLWRMYVPDERLIESLEVRVQMIAPDGSPGRLGTTDGTRSAIRAVARSTPPVVVERDGDGAVVQGGLTLLLDLEEIRNAGTYTGTLSITIDNF